MPQLGLEGFSFCCEGLGVDPGQYWWNELGNAEDKQSIQWHSTSKRLKTFGEELVKGSGAWIGRRKNVWIKSYWHLFLSLTSQKI